MAGTYLYDVSVDLLHGLETRIIVPRHPLQFFSLFLVIIDNIFDGV
jgi:hypothetical protein